MARLAEAVLSPQERGALARFAQVLEHDLGSDLRGVWLYGSRARGEWTGPESDVDLLVVTEGELDHDELRRRLDEAADAEGANRFFFSLQVYGVAELAERRAVEAFFEQEVDRDRIVVAGDPEGLPGVRAPVPELLPGEMRPRTRELLQQANDRIEFCRLGVEAGVGTPIVSTAYYAALSAARAALSEEDRHARTHDGTWKLFRETFVLTGRFDQDLYAAANRAQGDREKADYKPLRYTPEEARTIFAGCERFVRAVEEMIGA